MNINFTDTEERKHDGVYIDTVQLNRIARQGCKGLTYLMNVMDENSTDVYMWFVDDDTNTNYYVNI